MLVWPPEIIETKLIKTTWHHVGSNYVLDFHGDPTNADLVIFSDGNHHMALNEALQLFKNTHQEIKGIFYTTTLPGLLLEAVKTGRLQLGNLLISMLPHVCISPPEVLDKLVTKNKMLQYFPFMSNQGSVFLVKKGNPKNITRVADLAKKNVKLFISNPIKETISYKGYRLLMSM